MLAVTLGWRWLVATEALLQVSVQATDMVIGHGQFKRVSLALHNPSDQIIQVAKLTSSCDCFRAIDLPWLISSRETKIVFAGLDMTKESHFTGMLDLGCIAKTVDDRLAFQSRFRLVAAINQARFVLPLRHVPVSRIKSPASNPTWAGRIPRRCRLIRAEMDMPRPGALFVLAPPPMTLAEAVDWTRKSLSVLC